MSRDDEITAAHEVLDIGRRVAEPVSPPDTTTSKPGTTTVDARIRTLMGAYESHGKMLGELRQEQAATRMEISDARSEITEVKEMLAEVLRRLPAKGDAT